MKKKDRESISFPASVLAPVNSFLKSQLKELKRRREAIREEDPFSTLGRDVNIASPDTEAGAQFGHARASAISQEIDRKIIQTKKALARVKIGKYGICTNCGRMIDTDRLMFTPEATLCITCEKKKEGR